MDDLIIRLETEKDYIAVEELTRVATLLRVLATRQGNTDEDDSGLARTLRYGNHGKYI